MREKKTLAWASVSHFFIDFLCAWLITHQLIENGSWFFLLFLYNFLAFAAQLPLGILLDALCAQRMAGRAGAMGRLLQDNARLITAGTGCLFCGAALLPGIGHLPLVLLCGAGNAMFHVGTGSDLLEKSEGKAWPSGLFVSTGAVGIFAGALVPLSEGGRILAGCILILLCALLFLVCRRCHGTGMHGNSAEHAAVLPRDRGGLAMTVILQNVFLSWLLTVLIESITAYVLGIRGKKNYILLFLVNTATNPAAVLLYLFLYSFTPLSELASQVCVELLVFAAEGLLFRASMDAEEIPCRSPWKLSAVLNLVSWGTGVLLSLLS